MINWTFSLFNDLNIHELYKIMALRSKIFVVEQNCVYQDLDEKDQQSSHLCGWEGDKLIAYTRILPPGVSYKEASLGRVMVHPDYRTKGIGKELTEISIEKTLNHFNVNEIRISAQSHLIDFYIQCGFIDTGKNYLEDDIPHTEMFYKK